MFSLFFCFYLPADVGQNYQRLKGGACVENYCSRIIPKYSENDRVLQI